MEDDQRERGKDSPSTSTRAGKPTLIQVHKNCPAGSGQMPISILLPVHRRLPCSPTIAPLPPELEAAHSHCANLPPIHLFPQLPFHQIQQNSNCLLHTPCTTGPMALSLTSFLQQNMRGHWYHPCPHPIESCPEVSRHQHHPLLKAGPAKTCWCLT